MTVDQKCHDFSRIWLSAGGWSHDVDVMKLAELVQELAEGFVNDLEADYEAVTRTDPR